MNCGRSLEEVRMSAIGHVDIVVESKEEKEEEFSYRTDSERAKKKMVITARW